jgi:hypothetical protein
MVTSNREQAKAEGERASFRRFVERRGDAADWLSIDSRQPPEPDLLCEHRLLGQIAFEVVTICDATLEALSNAGPKATPQAISTSDPSAKIIAGKLTCNYGTTHPIELLVDATAGIVISTDDMIIPTITPIIERTPHPFRRVWFLGETGAVMLWERHGEA